MLWCKFRNLEGQSHSFTIRSQAQLAKGGKHFMPEDCFKERADLDIRGKSLQGPVLCETNMVHNPIAKVLWPFPPFLSLQVLQKKVVKLHCRSKIINK